MDQPSEDLGFHCDEQGSDEADGNAHERAGSDPAPKHFLFVLRHFI